MSEKSSLPGPDEDATQPFSRPGRDASPDETAPYEPVDDPDATRPLTKPGAGEEPDATQVVDAWTGRAEVRGPVPPADTEEWTEEEEEPGRRWWLPILLGLLAVLVVVAVIAAAMMLSSDGNEQPVPTPSAARTAPTTQAPSPSAQPSSAAPSSAPPSASTVLVPETFGDSQSVATGKLTALGLNVHVVTQEDPVAQPGTVLATTPPAGSVVPAGSDITIIVAKAIPSSSPIPPSPSHQPPEESLSPQAGTNGD